MLIYREEIDGLRCLAVLSVIEYHTNLSGLFVGGYIGVDIFFVISGYLITSIIENEYEAQKFSLIHFYERRCRRILPLLLFLLLLNSLFAYKIMYSEQLKEFGQTLISILCLSSNILFWYKDDGYFSKLTELNPLVHTWSLAVEEQFYLIFPFIYYLLRKKILFLVIILIIISLLSLLLCQWGGNLQTNVKMQFQLYSQHSLASFYLPFGRLWELLLGSFSAFYLHNKDSIKKSNNKCNELFSFIGLLMIIISITSFDTNIIPPFPNIYTLVPTLGSTLIILYCNKDTLVGRLLSLSLFRWIGLISYSLYLWHQPLLAFVRLLTNQNEEKWPVLLIIIIIFPLSILSYVFIEKPFRNKDRFSQKQIFCFSLITTIIIFMIGLFLIQSGNNQSILRNPKDDPYLYDLKNYGNGHYVIREFDKLAKKRTFSNESLLTNKRVALIGDSYAQDFYNIIIEGKHLRNYEIRVHFVSSRCQIYLGEEDRLKFIDAKDKQICSNINQIKDAYLLIQKSNIIILAAFWLSWSVQRLPATIKLLNLTKQQQLFVIGQKHFGKIDPSLYINKPNHFRIKQYQYPKPNIVRVNRLLESILDKSIFIDIQKMICIRSDGACPIFTPHGKLISHDGGHCTKYGAIYIGNIIFKNKPLKKL